MNNKSETTTIESTNGELSRNKEQLYEIMIIANELSKECLEKEDFQTFNKANEIFNNARDVIQRWNRVESF